MDYVLEAAVIPMFPRQPRNVSLSERLHSIATKIRNLPAPSRTNPEEWYLAKDELAHELKKVARIAQRKPV